MKWNDSIFKKNDIRGIYKKDFDLDFVKNLGFSFVNFIHQKEKTSQSLTIALGHDPRLSSPEIAEAFAHGLKLAGEKVLFLGMVPTPVCFSISSFLPEVSASVMITASHNPKSYNGFKFLLNNQNICAEQLLELKRTFQQNFCPPQTRTLGSLQKFNAKKHYIQFLKKEFITLKDKQTPICVIDCGNGASGPVAKEIFKALNLPAQWLFSTPNGKFPHHHPDPSINQNLKSLQEKVLKTKSSLGAAFDGDGDRLVIVTSSGKILHGDELLFIFLSSFLKSTCQSPSLQDRHKKPSFVVDIKCADWFFNFLKNQSCKVHISPSGHSLVRQKTIKTQSLFGGEFSGHFFFCDRNFPFDDGIYCLLRLIEIISNTEKSIEELLPKNTELQTYEIRIPIDNIALAKKRLYRLKSYYTKQASIECSLVDGVRVSFPGKGWGLARLSNTQNEFTFRFGGKTENALKNIQQSFYHLLKIPFPPNSVC